MNAIEIKGKYLNATTLKILAVVLMVFDHVHQMWVYDGVPMWFTWLGRPVFPIFLFVMAESFHYTRNRKKLMLRLLFASWFMIIVNFTLGLLLPNHNVVLMNNAFSTFFIATLYMLFWDLFLDGHRQKNRKKMIGAILLCFVPILTVFPILYMTTIESPPLWLIRALFLIPNIVLVEGGFAIVILGILFYVFRRWRWAQILVLLALSVLQYIISPSSPQWMMVFAIIPIFLYNGEKGQGMKNFFYIFYPAHIYLLYVIATLMQ